VSERIDEPRDPRSIGAITGDLLTNAQEVLRDEVRLARVETVAELKAVGRAAAMLIAGALIGFAAFLMLLFTATWALDTVLPLWLSAAIVTLVVGAIAGVLVMAGKSRVSDVSPKPERTVETMKENVQWIKQPTR
jgi:hypothetical protein